VTALPQQLSVAQSHKWVQVAQSDAHVAGAPVTRESVGQPAEAESPLAENPPLYYSGVAAIAILAMLVFVAVCRSKGLHKRAAARRQLLLEQAVASITWFARNAIGPGGEKFAPLVGTVFGFIMVSNLMGVLPLVLHRTANGLASYTPAPTSNLSMTLAIALVVFVVVQYVGIKENGIVGYLKHFAGPVWYLSWLMFPLELIGAISKPISLSIRLFGNIFGEETVTAALIGLALTTLPHWLPLPFQLPMLMFGVFGSIVQAGVFTILTCAYISLSIGEHDHNGVHHTEDEFGAEIPLPAHH
jgi:F-type H+-transporting ATPase subunit a